MLEYWVFRLLSLLAPLPPPRVAYWLCDRIGDITWRLLPARRRTVERNLSIVLRGRGGDLARRSREVFREGVKYYYDTFRVPALSVAELERQVAFEGFDRLEKALDKGKGAIVVTAHLGSPALVAQIMAARGCKVTTVAEPVRPQKLLDLMTRVRAGKGIRVIPLGPGSARDLAETLRRNEVVGLVADRDIPKTGVPVEFFGVQTPMPGGPVMLALRTGAVLIPGYTYRRDDGRCSGYLEEPLELVRTGDLRGDVRLNTQKLVRGLERAIERHPEQWIVFEPIWPEQGVGARSGVDS